eukprot:5119417-Pleurochrysis_carterae.AAC.1
MDPRGGVVTGIVEFKKPQPPQVIVLASECVRAMAGGRPCIGACVHARASVVDRVARECACSSAVGSVAASRERRR